MIKSGMEFARNSKNSAIKSGTVIGVISDSAKTKLAEARQEDAKRQALSSIMPQYKAGQNTIADSVADAGARIKGFGSANEEKKYAAENPNLYSAMGGAKYNPIPSKTPTVLTDEGKQAMENAKRADKGEGIYAYNINSINIADRGIVNSAAQKVKANKLLELTAQEKYTLQKLAREMKETYGETAISEYTGKENIDMFDALWWLTGAYQNASSQSQMLYQGDKAEKLRKKRTEQAVLSADDFAEKVRIGKKYLVEGKETSYEGGNVLEKFAADYSKTQEKTPLFLEKVKNSKDIYKYMTENEKGVYYYFLGSGKIDAADDYAESLKSSLENRKANFEADNNNFFSNLGDAISTGYFTGAQNIGRSISGLKAATNQTLSELDKKMFETTYDEKLWSEIQTNSGDRKKITNLLLETVNSVASQIPAMVVGSATGQVGYFITMSANIIGGTTTEAINAGYEAQQGFIHGLIESALEATVEKALGGFSSLLKGGSTNTFVKSAIGSVDKAVKNKFIANLFAKTVTTLGQGGAEGVEEFLQELTGPLVRNLIYGENNKYSADTFKDAIHAFAVGALSGMFMSAPYIKGNVNETRAEIIGDVINAAGGVKSVLALAEIAGNDSQLYQSIKEKVNSSIEVDSADIGYLYQESFEKFKNPNTEMMKSFAERNVDAVIAEAQKVQSSTNETAAKNAEYTKATANSKILDLIKKVKSGIFKTNDKEFLNSPSEDVVKQIIEITGIDVSGFKVAIEARQIEHILKDHGENGAADHSMSDDLDIAKMEYTLNSPDSIVLSGTTQAYVTSVNGKNKPAKTVLYEKSLGNNSYYVVQAVPDTKAKTLYIVSAFIGKEGYKKETSQTTDAKSPSATPNSENASVSSDITVPQNVQAVNNNMSEPASFMSETRIDTKTRGEVEDVCSKLGRKVVFEDLREAFGKGSIVCPDGFIDADDVIHVNLYASKPIEFIIKHELTHFGEHSARYSDFVERVENSKVFADWLKKKTGLADASVSRMKAVYRQAIMDARKKVSPVDVTEARAEMIADFVGESLFTDGGSGLKAIANELDAKQRSKFIQYILDFISYLKKRLNGTQITNELSRLEDEFSRMLADAARSDYDKSDGNKYTFTLETDASLIAKAEQMEKEGASRDEIWRECQIVRDIDGAWVCELDDHEMIFYLEGDALIKQDPNYSEFKKLSRLKNMTDEQKKRYNDLNRRFLFEYAYGPLLRNYLVCDSLYQKYPQLWEAFFFTQPNLEDVLAKYDPETNAIIISEELMEFGNINLDLTLVHEIQHALQTYDKRENGASVKYWNARILSGETPRNPTTQEPYTAKDAYYNTAGEIESFESEKRYLMTPEQRKNTTPDLGWDRAVRAGKGKIGVKYSIPTNQEYLSAVETNNTETVQQMVDAAARAAGYTERLYHQTNADFTEFNTNNQKAGKYDWELPTGTFLKPTDDDIGLAGKKQMELYAKLNKPLEFANRYAAQKFWSDNIEGYAEAAQAVKDIDVEYRMKSDRAINAVQAYMKQWRENSPNANRKDIYNDLEFQRLYDDENRIIEEWGQKSDEASLKAKQLIDNFIAENDYDGIIVERDQGSFGRYTKTYVVFDSSQLKDASPVTYDDSGNIISLSERFNKGKRDIRYSIPVETSVDNYTEEQYNNFGWVRVNNVLTVSEYNTLLSRYADYKHNKDKYPITRFGEAVIHSTECPDVIMYVKGDIGEPNVTKIVRIVADDSTDVSVIRERIIRYEYEQKPLPYKTIIEMYGEEYLTFYRRRDYESFREVETRKERERSQGGNTNSGTKQNRAGSVQQNSRTDRAGLKESAFSMSKNKYSIITDTKSLLDRFEKGEISRDEYVEELETLWTDSIGKYGMLPEGVKANNPIPVPKQVSDDSNVRRFVRTFIERGELTDEMFESLETDILLGEFSYKAVSDESAMKYANSVIDNNANAAAEAWDNTVNGLDALNKKNIAIGEQLLADAVELGDTKRVLELSGELADVFTRAGQVVQAARLIKQMTGVGRLVTAQRMVKTINKDLLKKYGENAITVKIDPTIAEQLANAKNGAEIEFVYKDLLQDVADQVPVTFLDKWNAWRYFAMLSNPKTHIRNIVGNTIFIPVLKCKNLLAAGIENVSVKVGVLDKDNKTKSVKIKKEYRDFAEKDSENTEVKQLLKGGKYDDKTVIKEQQRIFKTEALEFLTRFNSNALEMEDTLFKNHHYINAFAGYLQARNVDLKNVTAATLDAARIYAVKEARKATYNDESAIASAIQRFGNKNIFLNIAVEGMLPFKRTPVNIIKRGIEYSPIGLMKTLTKGVFDVKKGAITPTEFIDGLASGLTGTGIAAIGMLLSALGYVTGGFGDDDESEFEKLLGKQEYAVEFLGKSYTIDFAAPACIPFFIGVEIINTAKNGEEITLSKLGNTVWNSLEPVINLSMLSGIQGVIESARYAEPSQILSSMLGDVITSYGMQALPSLFGATARTIDPKQRVWYTDKNSKILDSFTQGIINNVKSKIPGLSFTMIPKIDIWGNEVSRGDVGERIAENFVSPGYYSSISKDEINKELLNIGKSSGEDVYPKVAAKSFDVNGETKLLTPSEYVTYAKAKGRYSYEYVSELVESVAYNKLTAQQKAKAIDNLYKYANAKAKTTVSNYDITKSFKTVYNLEKNGGSVVNYYISKALVD